MIISKTRTFVSALTAWITRRGASMLEPAIEPQFGEDSILQQVDEVVRCPRTGLPVEGTEPDVACPLADGSCSELASNGIRVACLRDPAGMTNLTRQVA